MVQHAMTFELVLAGPGQQRVIVPRKTTKDLQTYKKNAIRFIYNSVVTNLHGAILNVDLHMNHEHACAVAINALYNRGVQKLHTIVLCSESRSIHWFYFMKKYSALDVFKPTANNVEQLLQHDNALLLIITEKEHALLRNHVKEFQFFCVLADQIDLLCEKLIAKQIQAEFRVGITHRNFITDPNQQLRWKIINWALMKQNKQLAKLSDFIEYDNAYLKIHVDPYASFWHTITWELCSPADREQCEANRHTLLENIERFAQLHGLQTPSTVTRGERKAAPRRNKAQNTSKKQRLRKHTAVVAEYWTSDEDNLPDLSVFETSITTTQQVQTTHSPKKLRLKSPKGKQHTVDDFNSNFVELKRNVAQSARVRLFDQALFEEFSVPFNRADCWQASKLDSASMAPGERSVPAFASLDRPCEPQATKSDAAVIAPGLCNVPVSREASDELLTNGALTEDDISCEFVLGGKPSGTVISQHGLQTPTTGSSIESSSNARCKPKKVVDSLEELSLHLSENSINFAPRTESDHGTNELEAVCGRTEGKTQEKCSIWSSDEDLDNYMAQFIATMEQANRANSTDQGVSVNTSARVLPTFEEENTRSKLSSPVSDLRDFMECRKCLPNGKTSTQLTWNSDSQEDDNYLLAFL